MDITSYVAHLNFGLFTQAALFLHNYAYSLVAVLSLLTVPFLRKQNIYYSLAVSMVAVLALSLLLKDVYAIPRPCNAEFASFKVCPPENDYALPSGHTAFAFVFVAASLGTPAFPLYLFIGLVVGFSRIYLGVHTLADVAGGVVLGILTYLVIEEMVRVTSRKLGSGKGAVRITSETPGSEDSAPDGLRLGGKGAGERAGAGRRRVGGRAGAGGKKAGVARAIRKNVGKRA